MARIHRQDGAYFDAEYSGKRGKVLDLPAGPLHRHLHSYRGDVQNASSAKCNIVVAAFGLVHGTGKHWSTVENGNLSNHYFGGSERTPSSALAAKEARENPRTATDALKSRNIAAARTRLAAEPNSPSGKRQWNAEVLPFAFCSGKRSTHKTPLQVKTSGQTITTIHGDDLNIDAATYNQQAERFNAAGGAYDTNHYAMGDNHSEFHFALWLGANFSRLQALPGSLNIPSGAKIYAVTVDFVSTNEICTRCARKLDAILSPGYLESLSESWFSFGYVTSTRRHDNGHASGLRLLIRASAFQPYSGAARPDEVGSAPIQVKSCHFDGTATVHETYVLP